MTSEIPIEPAARSDAAEILALQKLAYRSEAEIYGDFAIPPLTQTLEEMERDLERQVVLKATLERRIVGSVRAYEKEGTCHIGRLIVHPDCQGRGLGARLMGAIEARFVRVERYELFTGHRSARNLYLYQKLGYRAFRSEPMGATHELVFLEKRPPGPRS